MRVKISIFFLSAAVLLSQFCASSATKARQEQEKSPRYQYNVGIVYLNNGQLDEAIKYLNKALLLQSDFALAYDGLGLAYFMKQDFNQSVKYFEKCLSIDPKVTDAHNHLGSVYQEMGLLEKAEEHFLIAAQDQTYHSRELPIYNLARLHFVRKQYQEALEQVNRALVIKPRMILAHNLKGIIQENLDEIPAAISSYKQALRYSPDDVTLKYNLAGAYFKNREYNRAKELFLQIQPIAASEEMRENIRKYLSMIEKRD